MTRNLRPYGSVGSHQRLQGMTTKRQTATGEPTTAAALLVSSASRNRSRGVPSQVGTGTVSRKRAPLHTPCTRIVLRRFGASGPPWVSCSALSGSAASSRETKDQPFSQGYAELTERERTIMRERAANVLEVLTGFRSGSSLLAAAGGPRPQFDPEMPLMERYHAKAKELGVTVRALTKWVTRFRRAGDAGLAPASHQSCTRRSHEVCRIGRCVRRIRNAG